VINEAIALAKEYGSEDGHKYVNGILNKVARQIRTSEEFTDKKEQN
jgi:N utilization substance protein B